MAMRARYQFDRCQNFYRRDSQHIGIRIIDDHRKTNVKGSPCTVKRWIKCAVGTLDPALHRGLPFTPFYHESVTPFYHIDGAEETAYTDLTRLFRKYLGLIMRYVHVQNEQGQTEYVGLYGEAFEIYVMQFVSVLEMETTRRKMIAKLKAQYQKAVRSMDGVYRPMDKKTLKSFKTLSWPMRAASLRQQLAHLV